jgi:hypothetical protein
MTVHAYPIGRHWHILMPYIYTIYTAEVEVTKNDCKKKTSRKNKEYIGKLNNESKHYALNITK